MFKNVIVAALLAASSVIAHSNMHVPTPRKESDSAYLSSDENACGFEGTDVPDENNFQRGQKVPVQCASFLCSFFGISVDLCLFRVVE